MRKISLSVVALFACVAAANAVGDPFDVGAAPSPFDNPAQITISKVVDNAGGLPLPSNWSFTIESDNCVNAIDDGTGGTTDSRTVAAPGSGGPTLTVSVESAQAPVVVGGVVTVPCTFTITEAAVAGWTTTPGLVQANIGVTAFANTDITFTNASVAPTTTTTTPPTTAPPATIPPTTAPPATIPPTTAPPATIPPTSAPAAGAGTPTTQPPSTLAPDDDATGAGAGVPGAQTATTIDPLTTGNQLPSTGGGTTSNVLIAGVMLILGAGLVRTARRGPAPATD